MYPYVGPSPDGGLKRNKFRNATAKSPFYSARAGEMEANLVTWTSMFRLGGCKPTKALPQRGGGQS